ncbi:mucin-binding protein [Pediococcus acidilactici]|uniref:mucin-binding protein n=1 Tax=Pediococcus acidilactici TaxID=1254 RepID=UPI00232A987D|nr:BspA family leucine-rich repeat surface protein [Pediococcus acidilactici]MDB8858378.1 BspA family leucine-rich repeat surface protein [Pediococcus acidilactici]MDB8861430.1 BspA family leucine-rich repeat surface protein [Pediococcus acidilactici]MDB8862439.1 BspA family leucine-rich repeat surface protein [Pediococcus acidilactici]MDB8866860.1 BspA family leucine-rich repeat surface protein [Pediococcus acidilactici]
MKYEVKQHYKMYKDGKFWVFSGLAIVGLVAGLNVTAPSVSADTTAQSSALTPAVTKEVKSRPSDAVQSPEKAVTTKSQVTENQTGTQPSRVTNSDVTTKPVKQTEGDVQTSLDSDSKANTKAVNSNATSETKTDSKASPNSQVSASSEKQTDTPTTADNTVNKSNSTGHVTTPGSSSNNKVISSKNTLSKDEKQVNSVTKTKTPGDDRQSPKRDVKKDPKNVSSNVASGTFGTSAWYIDADGMLHFGEGEFDSTNNRSMWLDYKDNITNISFDGKVKANKEVGHLFGGLTKLKNVYKIENFDVSNANNFSYMFSKDSSLESIGDVSGWNTANVNKAESMFEGCIRLKKIDVSKWNTSNMASMKRMFDFCNDLTELDVSHWDVSSATTLESMFDSCANLKNLDLSHWNTSNVTNMNYMFEACGVSRLDLSHIDMSNVTRYDRMLTAMSNLRVLVLGKKTKIAGAHLSEPSFIYTFNRWVAVAGGTEDNPLGKQQYTSHELMDLYNPSMADTYVIKPFKTINEHQDVTQTIHYVNENGDQMLPDHTETRHYSRKGHQNPDTGEIYWESWKIADGENTYFDPVYSPKISGYTPDIRVVDKTIIDDELREKGGIEVTVTYSPNALTGSVTYWDDEDNKKVSTGSLNGSTDEDGNFVINVPAHYEIDPENNPNGYVDGQTVHFTWSAKDGANDFTVYLRHKHRKVDPDDPEWSKETTWTVNETVHYVDNQGKTVYPDTSATLTYHREVVIDEVNNSVISRGEWQPDTSNKFAGFDTPIVDGYVADHAHIEAQTVAKPGEPNQDITLTVVYYPSDVDVDPEYPIVPGTPVDPVNPDSPEYPAGMDVNDLNKDLTETIHYVDKDGKQVAPDRTITVHYTRKGHVHFKQDGTATISYDPWKADEDYPAVDSPVIDGMFPDKPTVAEVDGNSKADDFEETVTYYPSDVDVDPDHPIAPKTPVDPANPDGPHYPSGMDANNLNKDVTETIHYVDKDGKQVASDKTVTVHYTRKGHIHFNQDGSAKISYDPWVADENYPAVDSPVIDDMFPDKPTVAEVDGNSKADDFEGTVTYYPSDVDVNPDHPIAPGTPVDPANPDSPDYPAGVNVNNLNKDVTETIHYVDKDGKQVAPDQTITVHYTRKAHVHFNQDGTATVTYEPWKADGNYSAVDSPVIDGMFPDKPTVAEVDGNSKTDDFEETVTYYPSDVDVDPDNPIAPDTPVDPTDPDSPDYPAGVDVNDLNKDVTETIHYVDKNGKQIAPDQTVTVHYTRKGHVHFNQDGTAEVTYDSWKADGNYPAIDSPVIDGMVPDKPTVAEVDGNSKNDDFEVKVTYYPSDVDVDPDHPIAPDTPVDPSDPDSPDYPSGVDVNDLNKDLTETIHYVDKDGNQVAPDQKVTVHYTRKAHVHFNQDGTAEVTYDPWVADGNYPSVDSPVVDGMVPDTPTVKEVDGDRVSADFEITVIYHGSDINVDTSDPVSPDTPVDPDDPDSPDYPSGVDVDDLNKDVTETIHYVDKDGKQVAPDKTVTVHYTRKAHVHFNQDGTAEVTYDPWKADGDYPAVDSPVVDGMVPDESTVAEVDGDRVSADFEITVIYHDSNYDIDPSNPASPDTPVDPSDPDSPDYPAGVDVNDLNRDVTETIHYVDEDGKQVAPDQTATVHYTRKGHVHYNQDGTTTITYDPWVADGNFPEVDSPVVDGYEPDQPEVPAMDANSVGNDFVVNVIYHVTDDDHQVTPPDDDHDNPTPDHPETPDDNNNDSQVPVDPETPDDDNNNQVPANPEVPNGDNGNSVPNQPEIPNGDHNENQGSEDPVLPADNSGEVDGTAATPDTSNGYNKSDQFPGEPVSAVRTNEDNQISAKERTTLVKRGRLPQTNEADSNIMSEVGVLSLLTILLGFFGWGRKRKRDGEE